MTDVAAALAAVSSRLDIEAALPDASRRNDLLPDRLDDKVHGQLRAGWLAKLGDLISSGGYQPRPAEIVFVPKTPFSTRPASLLALEDRVVYEALVQAARPKIDKAIAGTARVMWPRGVRTEKRWSEFEHAPLANDKTTHVVLADVAGFYESIDHARLRKAVLEATGWTDLAVAIEAFLSAMMTTTRGLPQGVDASDSLATLYLARVDGQLANKGLDFYRHGDDVRIGAKSYSEALRAAHAFETAVRDHGLLVNTSKLTVRTRSGYERDLADVDTQLEQLTEAWRESVAGALLSADDDEDVTALMEELGLEDLSWDWYHGSVTSEELVDQIKPHLTPSTAAVAHDLWLDTVAHRPGGPADRSLQLSREQFHGRIAFALGALRSADDPRAIGECGTILLHSPDESENVCRYLLAVASKSPGAVARAVHDVLEAEAFLLDWQMAWLFRVLATLDGEPSGPALAAVRETAESDSRDWLARVEAARLLAHGGLLNVALYRQLHDRAPTVYRVDLLAAAIAARKGDQGFESIVDAARVDPLLAVIATNLG